MIKKPEYDMNRAEESLREAIRRYKKAYELTKRDGDDLIMNTSLRLAMGARSRLLRTELEV